MGAWKQLALCAGALALTGCIAPQGRVYNSCEQLPDNWDRTQCELNREDPGNHEAQVERARQAQRSIDEARRRGERMLEEARERAERNSQQDPQLTGG
jgi:hypothetical protein